MKGILSSELLIITAGRLIQDGQKVFVGTFWPIPAAIFAKKAHAINITLIFEGGIVTDVAPPRIPLVASDPCLVHKASLAGDLFDTLGTILHGQWADVVLLSANNVDRFGNINTTCIGSYKSPRVRLAGSGGACDFGSLAKSLIIILEHKRHRFPEVVDYITTPGYLSGGYSREEAGLLEGTGPTFIVTTLGIFGFDPESKEMVLKGIQAGVSLKEVLEEVQWPLRVSDALENIPPPSQEEIRILREEVDPEGMFIRDARIV